MEWSLAIVAVAVLVVAPVSGRIAGTPVTPAILFVAIGVLVGPKVLGEVELSSSSSTVRSLAEATLALVLFSDASRSSVTTPAIASAAKRNHGLRKPRRPGDS